jgi:choline dehydrogenase-like flavoprotein
MNPANPVDFDAIVIGSGITGGWAAKELTEKGLKVLLLERGKDLQHASGYLGEHVPDWKLPFQNKKPRALYAEEYPVQSSCYAFSEANRHFFNNDKSNPYVYDKDRPFDWIRSDVVGGRSLLWGRQAYRWSEQDFLANQQDQQGMPWPIGYRDLAPWYSYVEKFIGVNGEALGLPQLPDSEFLPPMEMYALEKTIKARLKNKAPDIALTMGRSAILTRDHGGRSACHYCGPCHRGCSTGSYFSSQSSTLPAAQATGNLTLKANAVVERLVYDPHTEKISEARVIDSNTGEHRRYSAKLFFVCASTVASTQLLLNSHSEYFPNGLANRSGVLGRYLMDHAYGTLSMGIFLDNMDRYYRGVRPTGMYIPRFRNLQQQDKATDFFRGYGYQTTVLRADWKMAINKKGFGADFKNSLLTPSFWLWALTAFIECLPKKTNRMYLHKTQRDRFGIPQVAFDFVWSDNEHKLWRDAKQQADRIMKAAGAVVNITEDQLSNAPGSAIHEMGTARMGNDASQSVLNAYNQAHDVNNLFVTDGSAMVSSSCVNPSLTYMALTVRACDYAVTQLKQGAI